jgi:rhodanese-related sulfurtransferase
VAKFFFSLSLCGLDFSHAVFDVPWKLFVSHSAPIITHCKSGARAGRAKTILKGQGYKTVVNAGGFGDLDWLQEALTSKEE